MMQDQGKGKGGGITYDLSPTIKYLLCPQFILYGIFIKRHRMTIRQTSGGQCVKDIPDVCLYYILSVLFTKRALEQHEITRHNVNCIQAITHH